MKTEAGCHVAAAVIEASPSSPRLFANAYENLDRPFKPLTQLDAGLAREHGGAGLGVALARRLAELNGGTIEVESEPGKGGTFTLRLPIEGHS